MNTNQFSRGARFFFQGPVVDFKVATRNISFGQYEKGEGSKSFCERSLVDFDKTDLSPNC